jgi:RNA polymerase sigma factor (sigma-70 family)
MKRDASGRDLFASYLGLIHELIGAVSRNGKLVREDAEDFGSYVMVKLIENDYGRLEKFKGESSLRTFLTVVIQRLLVDYRRTNLGKWRPSMRARRLGPVAIKLEQLLWRDGYTFQEAVHALRWNWGVAMDRDALWRLSIGLPQRRPARPLRLDSAAELPGRSHPLASDPADRELSEALDAAISKSFTSLSESERLTLQLRFERGWTAREIGAYLDLPPRAIYRRVERSLRRLRRRLESNGMQREHVRPVLASCWKEVSFLERLSPASITADA